MKKVSILIPSYNEEASLPKLYEELSKMMDNTPGYNWEVLFVNDGSTDHTIDIIKQLQTSDSRICYVDLSRNFGKENAMLAGFDYATGDCLVIIDADLQHPPRLIPQMLEQWELGYEDVYAKRISRGKESWLRRNLSLLFYAILNRSTRFEMLQNVGDFRLLDRKCINALKMLRKTERYTKGMFCWIGFRKKEITFNQGDRIAGTSNWNIFSLINFAIEGLVSFTTSPLRISTLLGLIIALVSFILVIVYTCKAIIWGDPVQGFPTLITTILFLGGVQLLSIGVLGEYIGRVFNESKQRPTYIVREYSHPVES